MSSNVPPLSPQEKKEYIELHLFNELRWLLGAATEWSIQNQLQLGIVGYDIQVYAMDSAFLHARTLLEFFAVKATGNHYGVGEFLSGIDKLASPDYVNGGWSDPLHKFLMHAQNRSHPASLNSAGVLKHLKEMPVDFANEVLRLWEEFEDKLGKSTDPADHKLQDLAREKRKEAIDNSKCALNCYIAQRFALEKHVTLEPVFS